MGSFGAYSQYAYSAAGPIRFVPPALTRLAQSLTADPIVIMELSARSNTVTQQTDAYAAYSSLPYGSLTVPRTERVTTSFLFSTRPWTGVPADSLRPNQRAVPQLVSAGRVSRRVPVDSAVTRRGQRTIGDARLVNADGSLDYLLTDYTLQGGSVKAWVAEPSDSAADWALIYDATIDRVEATRNDINIGISTIADELKRPLQIRRYTGSGGLAGDNAVAGRLRPVAYGEIFGADPVLISQADRIYQVNDGPIQSVEAVYEGGLPYTFTADFPDYDALAVATLASGEYATCLARGLFRIGTTLAGLVYPLRVTLKGDNSGAGYVSSTGDILYRIARNRAFLPAINLDVSSFAALPRGRVGYYANGASEQTVETVFDRLLGSISSTYGVGRRATISIQRILPASSRANDLNIRGDQLFDINVEARPFTPRLEQPYSYGPTWSPVTSEQISPVADGSLAARLTSSAFTGQVAQSSTAVIPAALQPTLVTYFVDQTAAESQATAALAFSAENLVPLRASLGRLGLIADLGGVMALTEARFAANYRGVIYEQEDDLGATVTSRVVALG